MLGNKGASVKFIDFRIKNTKHPMKSRVVFICLLVITIVGCNPIYSVEQSMVERGYRWIYRGESGQAIDTFDMAIQKYPQSVLAHLGRADAFFQAQKDLEAVDSYTQAMSLLEKARPKSTSEGAVQGEPEVIGGRFFSYQNQGLKFPHGLKAYLHLHRGAAFESLAASDPLLRDEYFSKAIADYDTAIALAPKYEATKKQRNRLLERSSGTTKNNTNR